MSVVEWIEICDNHYQSILATKVATEGCHEWDLNPQPVKSVQML